MSLTHNGHFNIKYNVKVASMVFPTKMTSCYVYKTGPTYYNIDSCSALRSNKKKATFKILVSCLPTWTAFVGIICALHTFELNYNAPKCCLGRQIIN